MSWRGGLSVLTHVGSKKTKRHFCFDSWLLESYWTNETSYKDGWEKGTCKILLLWIIAQMGSSKVHDCIVTSPTRPGDQWSFKNHVSSKIFVEFFTSCSFFSKSWFESLMLWCLYFTMCWVLLYAKEFFLVTNITNNHFSRSEWVWLVGTQNFYFDQCNVRKRKSVMHLVFPTEVIPMTSCMLHWANVCCRSIPVF